MKALQLTFAILLVSASTGITIKLSAEPRPNHVPAVFAEDTKLDPQALREDFQALRRALEEGDSGIYRYTPKAEMDKIFDAAYARIDHPMDALEFYRLAAPVVGAVKCGHTRLRLSAELQKQLDTQVLLFPADVAVLGDKAYVLHDLGTDDDRLSGAEILKINGIPTNQILKTMGAAVHGDGNTATSGPYRLSHKQMFATSLYTLAGAQAPFQLSYRPLAGGKIENIKLQGKPLKEIQDALHQKFPKQFADTPAADVRFLDDGALAVLKIYRFDPKLNRTDTGATTKEFFKTAFEQMQSNHSTTLILDVRDNGGGEDELGKLLFSYLTTEPFPYYNDLIINPAALTYVSDDVKKRSDKVLEKRDDGKLHYIGHPNWGLQQPSQPGYHGKVFVLMNGGSFSTTCEFLSTLHFHHRATFIGQEVAGAYYGNTSGMSAPVTLPHSHLVLGLEMTTYYLAVSGNPHPDRGVMPDDPVHYTIRDLLAGSDKEMTLALEMARHPQK